MLCVQWDLAHPRMQKLGFTKPAERVRSSVIPLDLLTASEGGQCQLSPYTIPIVPAQFPLLELQDRKMLVRKDRNLATSTAHLQNLPFSLPPS